jgi:regulator of protease activity HflC (stomatin/prohibitin superfamily)
MKYEIDKYDPCIDAIRFRSRYQTFEDAWNNCERGDWMLWIAQRVGVDIRTLTLAKALCAKTVIDLMKDHRSINAVNVAERFGRGEADEDELRSAAHAASSVAAASSSAYAAAASAADYASASSSAAAAAAADYFSAASSAASASASAAASRFLFFPVLKNRKQTADICREILTKDVLSKIEKI